MPWLFIIFLLRVCLTEANLIKRDIPRWLLLRLFVCVVALFLFLRVIHLDRWLLANVDEIALLNNLSLPIFSGGYGSTTFFPAVQLTKAFYFVNGFPSYRLIGVLLNLAGLIFFYLALGKITGRIWSLVGALAYSTQWYLIYISRIYEIATFTPFFFSLQFFLVISWLVSQKKEYLIASFFVAGVGIDCYAPPLFYATTALGLILVYRAIRGRFSWLLLILCGSTTLLAMVPFFYVQFFVGDLLRDILSNYQLAGKNSSHVLLIHLWQPEIFLKTLTELLSFITVDHRWWKWLAVPVVTALMFSVILVIQNRKDSIIGFIGSWTFLTLVLTFFSPVAAYIQGHFTAFLLLYLASLVLLIGRLSVKLRLIPAGILAILIVVSCFWYPNTVKDQWSEITWASDFIRQQAEVPVPVSDGAFLALQHAPNFPADAVKIFTCANDKEIKNGMTELPCDRQFMVVATFDCNIIGAFEESCVRFAGEQRLTTLIESHLANGVVFYKTSPKDQERYDK